MTEYIPIEKALARLNAEFNWFDCFVRELYFTSAHCFQRQKSGEHNSVIGDVWGPRDCHIVVATSGSSTVFGIEFLCLGVQPFSLQRFDELAFRCDLNKGEVRLNFTDPSVNIGECWIVAKEVQIAFLNEEYLGPWLRLGHEAQREPMIDAFKINECWRQCSNCFNSWTESPAVKYSRCTECGKLTNFVDSQ